MELPASAQPKPMFRRGGGVAGGRVERVCHLRESRLDPSVLARRVAQVACGRESGEAIRPVRVKRECGSTDSRDPGRRLDPAVGPGQGAEVACGRHRGGGGLSGTAERLCLRRELPGKTRRVLLFTGEN